MSERAVYEIQTAPRMAPAIGIAGLLAGKECGLFYAPLLASPDSPLPIEDRFLPLPDRGKSTLPEIMGQLEERLITAHERAEAPLTVFGHSFGGLAATILALKHPDKISQVFCLAGLQEGISQETPASIFLKCVLGNPADAEKLKYDSDFMVAHRKKVATEWPAETSLHLISPAFDTVLLLPIGLGLELPEGTQQPQRRIAMPGLLGMLGGKRLLQQLPGLPPNVKPINALSTANHTSIIIAPGVIAYTRRARMLTAQNHIAESPQTPAISQSALPLAA